MNTILYDINISKGGKSFEALQRNSMDRGGNTKGTQYPK